MPFGLEYAEVRGDKRKKEVRRRLEALAKMKVATEQKQKAMTTVITPARLRNLERGDDKCGGERSEAPDHQECLWEGCTWPSMRRSSCWSLWQLHSDGPRMVKKVASAAVVQESTSR